MFIATKRLIIRNFRTSDVNDLHEMLGDADTMKYCEPAYGFEQTQNFLQNFCIAKNGALAAVHKDSNKVIGYILFKDLESSVYEIGWIINKDFRRQNFAFEACSAIISYAFEKLNIRKIIAETIDKQNSVGLMQKLGMKLQEVQKNATKDLLGNSADIYVYQITANISQNN